MSTKLDKIKEQIEYYLSDKNLEQDEYFRGEIESGPEGYVNLNVFQKCNKIKKLGVTNDEILNAIKTSTDVEPNDQKNSLRRKNNKELPEFKESINKKVKTENNNHKNTHDEEEKKGEHDEPKKHDEKKNYEPLVFSMTAENDKFVDWKILQGEIEKQLGTKVYYTRYSKDEKGGHFVVNLNDIEEEKKLEIVKNGLKIEDAHFKVTQIQDKDLESFWKDHGGHYTMCVERKNKDDKSRKKDRKTQKNERKEREKKTEQLEISLANRKYNDPSKVKNIFKQILNTTNDGDKIPEPSHTMLKDILKFHETGEKKMEKLKNFTVGIHPEYKNTRCFFIVREDGTKEDFSVQKCLDTLMNKPKNK